MPFRFSVPVVSISALLLLYPLCFADAYMGLGKDNVMMASVIHGQLDKLREEVTQYCGIIEEYCRMELLTTRMISATGDVQADLSALQAVQDMNAAYLKTLDASFTGAERIHNAQVGRAGTVQDVKQEKEKLDRAIVDAEQVHKDVTAGVLSYQDSTKKLKQHEAFQDLQFRDVGAMEGLKLLGEEIAGLKTESGKMDMVLKSNGATGSGADFLTKLQQDRIVQHWNNKTLPAWNSFAGEGAGIGSAGTSLVTAATVLSGATSAFKDALEGMRAFTQFVERTLGTPKNISGAVAAQYIKNVTAADRGYIMARRSGSEVMQDVAPKAKKSKGSGAGKAESKSGLPESVMTLKGK